MYFACTAVSPACFYDRVIPWDPMSTHLVPSSPIPSHRISSHPIILHPITSYPIPCRPIPFHSILSVTTPADSPSPRPLTSLQFFAHSVAVCTTARRGRQSFNCAAATSSGVGGTSPCATGRKTFAVERQEQAAAAAARACGGVAYSVEAYYV